MENVAYNVDCMDYMRTLPDKAFDLAVVDPPYGGVTSGGYMKNSDSKVQLAKARKYNTALWSQKPPDREYFLELFRISKNQIIWGGNYFQTLIQKDSQCWIVWDKENGKSKYADVEMAWTSFNQAARIFRFRWSGMLQGNMARKEYRIHPTQKPVALYSWIFSRFANPGDKIIDTHLGSGSSRIAAYDAGLNFVGCEIDKCYFKDQEERFLAHKAQGNLFLQEGIL